MKILLLNDDFAEASKSSPGMLMQTLGQELQKRGNDVTVITSHRRKDRDEIVREERHGLLVISLPISYRLSLRHWKCLRMLRVSQMLHAEMEQLQPDVVHAHNIHTYLTYDALRIARRYTERVFLTAHDVMSFAYARLATPRYLASDGRDNRVTIQDQIRQVGLQWNPFRNTRISRILRRNVRNVIAVSESLAEALRQNGIPRIEVIHHGIDCGAWRASDDDARAFRTKYNLGDGKVVLFGGRLREDKGARELLHALERVQRHLPETTLLVLGEKNRWGALAMGTHVEHVVTPGWIRCEDLPTAYAAADIVTTPSLCLDTFNMMNLEAMAAARPVVGTIFGGTPEVVEDGTTGFIVDPRNTAHYAEALTTLLTDSALAQEMGAAGRTRAEELFSLERSIEAYLALYEQ